MSWVGTITDKFNLFNLMHMGNSLEHFIWHILHYYFWVYQVMLQKKGDILFDKIVLSVCGHCMMAKGNTSSAYAYSLYHSSTPLSKILATPLSSSTYAIVKPFKCDWIIADLTYIWVILELFSCCGTYWHCVVSKVFCLALVSCIYK